MPIEQIATSNNEQQEAPKNEKLTKVETSNNIDYNLDSINEEKFQQFKEMTDYIKEKGGEYEKEYQNIMNNVIKPFEENLNKILYKNKDINSMSDKELSDAAEAKMNNQPKELKEQQELIKKINGNGSQEEVQKLNEIVNNSMADVQDFYNKIMSTSKGTTMPGESNPDSVLDAEPGSTAPDLGNEGNSGGPESGGTTMPGESGPDSVPDTEPGSTAPDLGNEGTEGGNNEPGTGGNGQTGGGGGGREF